MRSYLPALSVIAASLTLGACAAPQAFTTMRPVDVVSAPSAVAGGTAPSTVSPAYSAAAGTGVVQSVAAIQREGGSMWSVAVRMNDGSLRTVETVTDGIMVGSHVRLDHDGRLALLKDVPVVATAPDARSAATGSSAEPAFETRWVAPRGGMGRVESLTVVPNNAGFAAADGRQHVSVWRIGVRMDDGTLQVMDAPASGLSLGNRIRITNEGNIARVE